MLQLGSSVGTDLGSLASLVLGVSLATERLVAGAKTAFPRLLANERKTAAQETDLVADKGRRLAVLLIAFLSAFLTASLIATENISLGGLTLPFYVLYGATGAQRIATPFLALFAMGGSAFWTSVVAYASATKDIQTQSQAARALEFRAQAARRGVSPLDTTQGVAAGRAPTRGEQKQPPVQMTAAASIRPWSGA